MSLQACHSREGRLSKHSTPYPVWLCLIEPFENYLDECPILQAELQQNAPQIHLSGEPEGSLAQKHGHRIALLVTDFPARYQKL